MIKELICSTTMLLALCTYAVSASAAPTPDMPFSELTHPVSEAPEVVEFFSFYCGPCYQFATRYPVSEAIDATLPDGKKVVKYHVSVMGKLGKELSEAWAIATVMGKEDAVEKPLFDAVQKQHSVENVADIKALFSLAGISAAEYESAQNSMVVKALVAKQEYAMKQFAVTSTPTFFVAGRYRINNAAMKAASPQDYVIAFSTLVLQLLARQ